MNKVLTHLEDGKAVREMELTKEEREHIKYLGLLTDMKVIYAANVPDSDLAEGNALVKKVQEYADKEGAQVITVSAQVEAELVDLPKEDRQEFLESLGVSELNCGLRSLVRATYSTLDLQTYFTSGPKESRAWTIRKGFTAPQAAGVIHTDFERGFIRAETVSYDDMIECGSEKAAKEKGKLRSEGKEYVVNEGDVMLFRFNV